MRVTFKSKKRDSDINIYVLTCSAEEATAYKTANPLSIVDESGQPLYFTKRILAADIDYKLDDKGTLVGDAGATQKIFNALAQVQGASLTDLQKYAAMAAGGLLEI